MYEDNRIKTNINLLNNIYSFLEIKELSKINSINRSHYQLAKGFNPQWQSACYKQFFSDIDNHNILDPKVYLQDKERGIESEDMTLKKVNFKKCLQLGVEIKKNWGLYEKYNDMDEVFCKDLNSVSEEVLGTLKEYYMLPKLRKENMYLENDLNSTLQIHLFDFLYDQQDLYDHYDDIFYEREENPLAEINPKNPDLPFSSLLINIDTIYDDFESQEDKLTLNQFRWYSFNEVSNYQKEMNNYFLFEKSGEFCEILQGGNLPNIAEFAHTSPVSFLIDLALNRGSGRQQGNKLLFILQNFLFTVTFFCKLSYLYLEKYANNEQIYFNELSKKYKSYVESAIYINDYLENLNVLVNYTYEKVNDGLPCNPKFSVLRMMMIVWTREVLDPLTQKKEDQNLINKLLKTYNKFLISDINKVCSQEGKPIFKASPSIYQNNERDSFDFADNDFGSSMNESYELFKVYSGSSTMCSSSIDSMSQGNNQGNGLMATKSIYDEMNSFEFQAQYFIEQIASMLLDSGCNEYSTFYVNSTAMKVEKNYEQLENGISNILENFLHGHCGRVNKLTLTRYFKNSSFLNNKFIPRSKLRFIFIISQSIIAISVIDLFNSFVDFLSECDYFKKLEGKSQVTCNNVNAFKEQIQSPFESECFERIQDLACKNENLKMRIGGEDTCSIINYALIKFFREKDEKKIRQTVQIMEEVTDWVNDAKNKQEYINTQVEKENKRKNIKLNYDNQELLYNFTSNVTWGQILDIHKKIVIEAEDNLKFSDEDSGSRDISGSPAWNLMATHDNSKNFADSPFKI